MALDPSVQQLQGQIPDEWIANIARWPVYYQRMYVQLLLAGDEAGATAVVNTANALPWQWNSAGLMYPNQDWFLALDPTDQQWVVTYMNDPAKLNAAISAAQSAAATNPADQMAQQQLAKLLEYQGYAQTATGYLTSEVDPATLTGTPPAGAPVDPGAGEPGPPATDPFAPTTPGGTGDQGKYAQDVDEAARADPRSFVGYILGQMGADATGNNPLSASALRKASLTPYMRELQAGGYQNAPLYTYGDWVENWVKNNSQPGAAGGGTGTAFTFGQGSQAIQGLLGRATDKGNLEYDALNGGSPQDAVENLKTYLAAGFSDSLDPTYQQAAQSNTDRAYQSYMDSVYGGNANDSFIDWYAQNGGTWMQP